jgi:hypothetical protein
MSDFSTARRRFILAITPLSLTSALAIGMLPTAHGAPVVRTEDEWFAQIANLRGLQSAFRYSLRVESSKNGVLEVNVADVFYRSHRKVLVMFREPQAVAGRRILIDGDDMWLGMPTSQRILRILPSQRLLGEASNGDIVNTNLYLYRMVEQQEDTYNDTPVLRLRLEAKQPMPFYQRIDYLFDRAGELPKASRHYAASGKLLKTIEYVDFSGNGKSKKLRALRILNAISPEQFTLMTFSNYVTINLPDGLFVRDNLLVIEP